MTMFTKVHFFCSSKSLQQLVNDLRRGLDADAADLDIDIYVGLHDQPVSRSDSRIRVGIQTESLNPTGSADAGLKIDDLIRNIQRCDVVLDFDYDNLTFYRGIAGYDFGRLVVGPYLFPAHTVTATEPSDLRVYLLERPDEDAEAERLVDGYADVDARSASELDEAAQIASAVLHIGGGDAGVAGLSRLLAAYMNGNVLVTDECPKPFLAGRHCLSLATPITNDARQTVLDHVHRDFGDYTLSRVLRWAAAGRPTLPEVNYLGAYDRYNYGDLLMPILLDRYRKKYFPNATHTTQFHFTSLRDSDLSDVGGIPTRAAYHADGIVGRDGSVIVCGGEVIGTRRKLLLSHYDSGMVETDRNVPEFPFLPAPGSARRVLLNTVGGRTNAQTAARVAGTRYASFRDRRMESLTQQNRGRMMICPDSVMLMSRMIPLDDLRTFCRSEVLDRLPQRYLTYQAAPGHVTDSAKDIAAILRGHCDASGLGCVLLTIGYAPGHDDSDHLREVAAFDPDFVLMDDLNIYEIAYTIARSEIFAGTSLHGTITSMSYGTPFVPLHASVVKLRQYARTWAPESFLRRDRLSHIRTWLDAPEADRAAALSRLSQQAERMMELVEINNYIVMREALFDM